SLLGFILGRQPATGPDPLVAVATIITRERRFLAGASIGLLWGIGHTLTLSIAGTLVVMLDRSVPVRVANGLELLVALMLVVLGVLRLRETVGGILTVAPNERVADHRHGRRQVVHAHDGASHAHPSAALLAAWRGEASRVELRALAVGAVHGMAGTAAIVLLVLATLDSVGAAVAYLAVFGVGTLVGMTA